MGEKFGLGRHKHNLDGHGGTERLLHPAKLRRRRRMSKQRKGWNGTEAKTGAEKEGHCTGRLLGEGGEIYHRWLCRQRAKQKCSARRPLSGNFHV